MNEKRLSAASIALLTASLLAGCFSASPLGSAAAAGDIAGMRRLLSQGADIHAANYHKRRAINWAAEAGKTEAVRLLIESGANVDDADMWGWRAIHFAARFGDVEMVKMLLQRGADPSAVTRFSCCSAFRGGEQKTPAMIAAERGHEQVAALLRAAEAGGPKSLDPSEETPEDKAAFEATVRSYHALADKPALPEDARRFKVQAESSVRDKEFQLAAELYRKALALAPWWPAGHFNLAIILSETGLFGGAIRAMKRYLALVPKAADARAAQDKIYEWELKAGR